ncbi:MAG TPA: hypothetical protein VK879_22495 [Candidatus Sulfomarinibacteraceae bacterium]|nr:hypothetical protein [Candidatus Sulfomarinibacteraceae bacterium]
MTRQLIFLVALLPLLVACDAAPSRWQEWITDLVGGPSSTPPEGTPLLPTPTLATGAGAQTIEDPAGAPATEPPQQQATSTPETQTAAPEALGPFTGSFAGPIYGDAESSATLQLDLIQQDRQIEGTATLGQGLVVNAGGFCGAFDVPALKLNASDELEQVDGRHLSTTTTVEVSGFEITVELQATLAPDGETMVAEATMYPPSLCGATPTMTATLNRVE